MTPSRARTRDASQLDVMETIRRTVVARQPKAFSIDVSEVPMFSGGAKQANVAYEISGPDLDALETYANRSRSSSEEAFGRRGREHLARGGQARDEPRDRP